MKHRRLEGFGGRLASIRKSKGMTQAELADKVGVSRRVITYYEHEDSQPPGPMLLNLAAALSVSVDHLLGHRQLKEKADPRSARLLNRLRKIESLPEREQKAILLVLDGLLARHRSASSDSRELRK
jgi:transcriptional regulator with XRE-family HTH domain